MDGGFEHLRYMVVGEDSFKVARAHNVADFGAVYRANRLMGNHRHFIACVTPGASYSGMRSERSVIVIWIDAVKVNRM